MSISSIIVLTKSISMNRIKLISKNSGVIGLILKLRDEIDSKVKSTLNPEHFYAWEDVNWGFFFFFFNSLIVITGKGCPQYMSYTY